MIEVENLTKCFGRVTAVDHVTFSVNQGEILGFLGPNAAGKSTTFKILVGYLRPTEGSCRLGGYDMTLEPLQAKKQIGYLQESPVLYREMNVLSFLRFVAQAKEIPPKRRKSAIDDVVATCGLEAVTGKSIDAVSKGYRQRVALAQALLGSPPILLLDEPTSALDPIQVIEIRNLIRSWAKRSTIILSTHILSDAMACCTRIMIISQGRLVTRDALSDRGSLRDMRARILLRFLKIPIGLEKCLGLTDQYERINENDVMTVTKEPAAFRSRLFRLCAEEDWPLLEMRDQGSEIEEIFLQLTQRTTTQ